MKIKHPPENGNCSCKECYKPMSKLDELDREFDEKFNGELWLAGKQYPSKGDTADRKDIKSFARKYYEAGRVEEREALIKKIEDARQEERDRAWKVMQLVMESCPDLKKEYDLLNELK